VCGFGGLSGLSESLGVDRASRGTGGMGCVWVASGGAVCVCVLGMGA
jgi:hypothetical protein